MSIKSIHFLCAIPRKTHDGLTYGLVHEPCEFKLGLGPCGRSVIQLTSHQDSQFFAITQVSIPESVTETANTVEPLIETKVFTYKLTDIIGRITTTLLAP